MTCLYRSECAECCVSSVPNVMANMCPYNFRMQPHVYNLKVPHEYTCLKPTGSSKLEPGLHKKFRKNASPTTGAP